MLGLGNRGFALYYCFSGGAPDLAVANLCQARPYRRSQASLSSGLLVSQHWDMLRGSLLFIQSMVMVISEWCLWFKDSDPGCLRGLTGLRGSGWIRAGREWWIVEVWSDFERVQHVWRRLASWFGRWLVQWLEKGGGGSMAMEASTGRN